MVTPDTSEPIAPVPLDEIPGRHPLPVVGNVFDRNLLSTADAGYRMPSISTGRCRGPRSVGFCR